MPTANRCFDCNGKMKRPNPVHSFDFNEDGWVPHYCVVCGLCSDSKSISHRFIKRVLQTLCNDCFDHDYDFKSLLFEYLKETSFFDVSDLADQITIYCNNHNRSVNIKIISTVIYSELSYYVSI